MNHFPDSNLTNYGNEKMSKLTPPSPVMTFAFSFSVSTKENYRRSKPVSDIFLLKINSCALCAYTVPSFSATLYYPMQCWVCFWFITIITPCYFMSVCVLVIVMRITNSLEKKIQWAGFTLQPSVGGLRTCSSPTHLFRCHNVSKWHWWQLRNTVSMSIAAVRLNFITKWLIT